MKFRLASLSLSVAALFGFAVASANAGEMVPKPYLGISGVVSSVGDVDFDNDKGALSAVNTADFDLGYGALLRGGYRFGELRAELEIGYRKVDIGGVSGKTGEDGDVDAFTFMVNGAWDIKTDSKYTPYISLGAGLIHVDGDIGYNDSTGRAQSVSFDGTAPAGQVGVGVGYDYNEEIDIVGGYSFLAAPTGDTGQDEVVTIHSVQIGLNYNF